MVKRVRSATRRDLLIGYDQKEKKKSWRGGKTVGKQILHGQNRSI